MQVESLPFLRGRPPGRWLADGGDQEHCVLFVVVFGRTPTALPERLEEFDQLR